MKTVSLTKKQRSFIKGDNLEAIQGKGRSAPALTLLKLFGPYKLILAEDLPMPSKVKPKGPKFTARYKRWFNSEARPRLNSWARAVWKECQRCGSTSRLQVHHLSYERLGKELPEDVTLLCRDCHMGVHGRFFD